MKPRFGTALLRLFTVQASWNYERMVGVGAGVAEEPLVRDLADGAGGGGAYPAAVARGARYFNAHPYLVGLAVGAAARAEHDGASPDDIERLRTALAGPLGAIGDRVVWAGWLPMLAGLAIAGVAMGLGLRAIAGFLVVYNLGHVALRWWALRSGWTHGMKVVAALRSPLLQRAGAITAPGMALAMGFALPLAVRYLATGFAPAARAGYAAVAAAGFLLLHFRVGALTGLRLGLVLLALAVIVGVAWR